MSQSYCNNMRKRTTFREAPVTACKNVTFSSGTCAEVFLCLPQDCNTDVREHHKNTS